MIQHLLSLVLLGHWVYASQPQTLQDTPQEVGAERCLSSDSPFWCLAEETSRAFTADSGGKMADPLEMVGDLAASTFDLGLSSLTGVEEESRGKKKKKFAYLFMAMATMVALILPFKLKAIALMAATALFVGKIALIIASLVGLKKLVHKQGDDTTHVHYSGHRSDADSHYLAYSEHAPVHPAAAAGGHQQYGPPEERY